LWDKAVCQFKNFEQKFDIISELIPREVKTLEETIEKQDLEFETIEKRLSEIENNQLLN
jgi:hypothetical protein